ncbi:hypothetical protein H8356DRAFT_1647474 [Neocallimastix lanati (nom. inval.)]|uniref:Uncharacterized protein n=1 Tax=Neocallimastix californiae TaxID=1754190 RepID=A0A1Y2AH70_9FUNG|nr:hypothetical protein H8356DRAFT_1647474 [Neocallimastix sp. JGI-2020a]ORY21630.1 hypothetical protein LY90DRAFT_707400 [Neocallimastix californiae]|eukprot:ORY21630.1 hypothetical protein LY90DRAFT_707400 [Neocallimastix californiae]
MSYWDIIESSSGYIVFGIFSIIAIIYMVKFSIEIDEARFRQQLISNYKTENLSSTHNSPQGNNNIRYSTQINTSFGPMDSANTSFSSPQLPYTSNGNNVNNVNTLPPNSSRPKNVLIPPRKTNLVSPVSPVSNQYGNYLPTNNFRNSLSQANRHSRQYLLNNNY